MKNVKPDSFWNQYFAFGSVAATYEPGVCGRLEFDKGNGHKYMKKFCIKYYYGSTVKVMADVQSSSHYD
jgi:hypothetical protein